MNMIAKQINDCLLLSSQDEKKMCKSKFSSAQLRDPLWFLFIVHFNCM
jgi:hypothetical protein